MYKTASGKPQRAQVGICDDLDEWDEGRGWEGQEGGDVCKHIADSLLYKRNKLL